MYSSSGIGMARSTPLTQACGSWDNGISQTFDRACAKDLLTFGGILGCGFVFGESSRHFQGMENACMMIGGEKTRAV
ncbi:hypothetical protein A2U01_0075175 [Trifolium medium]|uniref:Uncharacterized protein n=1 Tax=Trifolium medium TaxID=97028 RepID=A0A392SYL1_9FABA|nr:hypothetical protein [Trifolium medium]